MPYQIYEKATGRYLWVIECSPELALEQETDEHGVIEGEYREGWYVSGDPPEHVQREPLPVVRDGLHFSAPAGVAWRVEEAALGIDQSGVDDDGEIDFILPWPGTYRIAMSLWPYLDHVIEVEIQ